MYLLLFILWIIFNGKITLEIIFFGLVISSIIYWFMCKFMDYSMKKDVSRIKKIPLVIVYIWVLIKEIVKANFIIITYMTSYKIQTEPILVKFKTTLKSRIAKVILANSITLTPGTITVSLEGDEYLVHCMDKDLSKGLSDSIFVTLLEKLEREE